MVTETAAHNGPWVAGGPASVRGLEQGGTPYMGRNGQFGTTHRRGIMCLFADGSVRFLRSSISPEAFEALATIAGGDQPGEFAVEWP